MQINRATDKPEPGFDPYYTWLGIPPIEQPPTHYRLLGISPFEDNPDVIANAAERQTRHLRSVASGPRSTLSQQLLNEVAAARVCLLDPAKKQAYDETLRQSEDLPPAGAPPTEEAVSDASALLPPTTSIHDTLPNTPSLWDTQEIEPPAPHLPPPAGASGLPLQQPHSGAAGGGNTPQVTTPVAPRMQTRKVASVHRRRKRQASQNSIARAISILFGGVMGVGIAYFIVAIYLPRLEERQRLDGTETRLQRESGANLKNHRLQPVPARSQRTKPIQSPPTSPNVPAQESDVVAEQPSSNNLSTNQPKPPRKPLNTSPLLPNADASKEQPFAELPLGVDLPEPSNAQAITLASLSSSDMSLELELLTDTSPLPDTAQIEVETLSGAIDSRWTIAAKANATAAAQPFAQLSLNGNELRFAWLPNAALGHATALKNCSVRMKSGTELQLLALRKPVETEPLLLDMDKARDVHTFTIDHLPTEDSLHLTLGDLSGFPSGAEFQDDLQEGPIGKDIVIEFAELPGAQLEVRLIERTDGLAIAVSPVFHENAASEVNMTRGQLERTVKSVKKTMASTFIKMRNNQGDIAALQRQKFKNAAADAGRVGKIKQLQTEVAGYQRNLNMLQRKLDAAPKIAELLDALHQNISLPFQIAAVTDTSRLVLVDGGLPKRPDDSQ